MSSQAMTARPRIEIKPEEVMKPVSPTALTDLTYRLMPVLEDALPGQLRKAARRYAAALVSELRTNPGRDGQPGLKDCTAISLLGCMLKAATLGLEIGSTMGHAYLIPRNNGKLKCVDANFQLGYKGMIDLAYRGSAAKIVSAHVVYKGEPFRFAQGGRPVLEHEQSLEMIDAGNTLTDAEAVKSIVAAYAVYRLADGTFDFEMMTTKQIEKHRRTFSAMPNSPMWTKSWPQAAKKTVIIRLLKRAPVSVEAKEAAELSDLDEAGVIQPSVRGAVYDAIGFDPPEATAAGQVGAQLDRANGGNANEYQGDGFGEDQRLPD